MCCRATRTASCPAGLTPAAAGPAPICPQVPFSPADQHLNDTPRDVLLKFKYAIRDLSKPKGDFVPLAVSAAQRSAAQLLRHLLLLHAAPSFGWG